jgi:hypothetical protein
MKRSRAFFIGAGLSKAAGMSLATELPFPLIARLQFEEMLEWLDGLRERLARLPGQDADHASLKLNIEQVLNAANSQGWPAQPSPCRRAVMPSIASPTSVNA